MHHNNFIPQVKICGLTRVEQALQCADLGADAIGFVFYPKSPRHLTDDRAGKICSALTDRVKTVGVFVNESFSNIMKHVECCDLSTVQLHGQESPDLVRRLCNENLQVIKALFIDGNPSLNDAENYQASAFLVECAQGKLPGGNALEWNWDRAKSFGEKHPLIIAGGLSPENVFHAIKVSSPHAVDVSSGVESNPGDKDMGKVAVFLNTVFRCGINKNAEKIF
ncbi:MAG: phosphoribosylanthranilate isomerase [Deltaproteobacteria bacterium]|nr:phosphoribosylanthranilate isomerase [Deltaproteobacteria bacterium]